MCGIAGVWGARGDAEAMASMLAHRGPDDAGAVVLGPARLATRRLAVIDPVHGHQPMVNEDRTVAVAFNGTIFNHVELRHELEKAGFRFRTRCDTEVVLRGFEAWGPDCVDRFNGMFAIAVASPAGLFLARDRLGEKPLYYVVDDDRLLFASEIKAFSPEIRLVPNLEQSFWELETPLPPDTLYDGIHELLPAHRLYYSGGPPRVERYWSLPTCDDSDIGPEEVVPVLRDLLDDAVRIRLRADVPLGVYLSGGLDSALIAALAGPTKAFTCRFALGDVFDEHHYAQAAADAVGCELVTVSPTAEDFREHVADLLYHLDHPIATASPIADYLLARRARRDVTVILNGQGADELFGGYVRYLVMLEERRLAQTTVLANYQPLMRHFWSDDMFGHPADRYVHLTKRTGRASERLRRVVHREFARHGQLVAQMGATDLHVTFPSLIQMNDRSSAAFGLENRTPFLDHRIVELAFSLPDSLKVRGQTTKWILREVARGLVPDAIIDRLDKKGLVVPVRRWLEGDLWRWQQNKLAALRARGIQVPAEDGRGEFGRRPYSALCLELWLEAVSQLNAAHEQQSRHRYVA